MRKLALWLSILAVILLPSLTALASDITQAEYLTTITALNSSYITAATDTCAVLNGLSTNATIAAGMLNASATDAVAMYPSGTDIAFMPSVNSTYPWCFFIADLHARASEKVYLYSGNATGGKLSMMLDGGMTVPDTMAEPGDNWSQRFTNIGLYGNCSPFQKSGAYYANYNETAQTLTAYVYADNHTPTATVSSPNWNNPNNSWDGNTGTLAVIQTAGIGWQDYITLSLPAVSNANSVKVFADRSDAHITQIQIDVYDDSSWTNAYTGGAVNWGAWTTYNLSALQRVSQVRFRGYNDNAIAYQTQLYEIQVAHQLSSVTALSVVPQEVDLLQISQNSTHIWLDVDGVVTSNTSYGDVPNTTDQTIYLNGVPYCEGNSYYKGGTLIDSWAWQYATTWPGSVTGNIATPSFRTTSSNANVSLSLYSQTSLLEASTPSSSGSGWNMISAVPSTPSNLFTEGGTSFPGGPEIQTAATNNRLPYAAFIFPFAFGTAGLAGIGVFKLTHNDRRGISGSLLLMGVTMTVVLVFWYVLEVIPGYILIPFGVVDVLLLLVWNSNRNTIAG